MEKTLKEAALSESPKNLRHLFAVMMTTRFLSNAEKLWEAHKDDFSEDIFYEYRTSNRDDVKDMVYNKTLIILQNVLLTMNDKALKDFSLPEPQLNNSLMPTETFNIADLNNYVQQNEQNLIDDQRAIYNEILESVDQQLGKVFFLDAPGGTG